MNPTATAVSEWTTHRVELEKGFDPMGALHREWLLTSGVGAYAMGTLPGVNTRRYHGLLVAATRPPVGRIVALNQLFEQLVIDWPDGQHTIEFSNCLFHNDQGDVVLAPSGHEMLCSFEKGESAVWTYRWRIFELRRELHVHWKPGQDGATGANDAGEKAGENVAGESGGGGGAATVRYSLRVNCDVDEMPTMKFRVQPMITLRDFHALQQEGYGAAPGFETDDDGQVLRAKRGDMAVTLHGPDARFDTKPDWWHRAYYPADNERGQGDHEDYFVPGAFEWTLRKLPQHDMTLTVGLGDQAVAPDAWEASRDRRVAHLDAMLEASGADEHAEVKPTLVMAADDFVVDRAIRGKSLSTILAGYPWFADWGRDTFIALPGLLLCTGRFDEARQTLQTFANAMDDGLIPNRFDDYDEQGAHYNTVDASLWFVNAAMEYYSATQDDEAWQGWLSQTVRGIVDAYIRGTHGNIHAAGDGLIAAGNVNTQLTWMDAACGDVVFTPRHGKAVEINALWYNALVGMAERVKSFDKSSADHYTRLAQRSKRAFTKVFFDDGLGYLIDHVWSDEEGVEYPDKTLRPNQIFAASLPYSPLPRTKQVQVVNAVREQLLTPYGLRTLPENDPAYHPYYTGDMFHRDEAYHQGTVWPWLIGPYAEAVLRVGKFSSSAREEAFEAIKPLLDQISGEGLGQLHEIHEAAAPHRPVGCIAQAWSVAEVLRVLRLIES